MSLSRENYIKLCPSYTKTYTSTTGLLGQCCQQISLAALWMFYLNVPLLGESKVVSVGYKRRKYKEITFEVSMLIQAIRKVLERKYKNRTPIADTIENDLKKKISKF